MKTWRTVAGILSMIFFVIVSFQSCAVGLVNTVEENDSASGSAGILVAFLLLVGGIVSVSVRKSKGKGAAIALIIIFGFAGLMGITNYDNYGDLLIWSIWCLINAGFALISIIKKPKAKQEVVEE